MVGSAGWAGAAWKIDGAAISNERVMRISEIVRRVLCIEDKHL
jgi:hypothetical protein